MGDGIHTKRGWCGGATRGGVHDVVGGLRRGLFGDDVVCTDPDVYAGARLVRLKSIGARIGLDLEKCTFCNWANWGFLMKVEDGFCKVEGETERSVCNKSRAPGLQGENRLREEKRREEKRKGPAQAPRAEKGEGQRQKGGQDGRDDGDGEVHGHNREGWAGVYARVQPTPAQASPPLPCQAVSEAQVSCRRDGTCLRSLQRLIRDEDE